jgi:hypothetical protein
MQPLDVTIFSPYKHHHAMAVDDAARTGCQEFTRTEFFAVLHSIREKTFQKSTVKKAFQETGLIPYNPEVILKDLCDPEQSTRYPETPSTHMSSNIETPKTVRTIQRYGRKLLEDSPTSERFQERLDCLIKSSIQTAHLAAELKDDLSRTKAAEQARARRISSRRRVMQNGGVLYAARYIKKKRDEDEVAKAREALRRAEERELREFKKLWNPVVRSFKKYRKELLARWKQSSQ